MILVDTSVWVDHFRQEHAELAKLLNDGHVLSHPFVIGELSVGNLRNRKRILTIFESMPVATMASYQDVLWFIDTFSLFGRGLSYIDIHLLLAARLSEAQIWTKDKRMHVAAGQLSIAAIPNGATH